MVDTCAGRVLIDLNSGAAPCDCRCSAYYPGNVVDDVVLEQRIRAGFLVDAVTGGIMGDIATH